jgi:hypothetical protein
VGLCFDPCIGVSHQITIPRQTTHREKQITKLYHFSIVYGYLLNTYVFCIKRVRGYGCYEGGKRETEMFLDILSGFDFYGPLNKEHSSIVDSAHVSRFHGF